MRVFRLCLLAIAATCGWGTVGIAAEHVSEQTVFRSGEGGYHTYRIPALIQTPKGTLLAFCEGRRGGGGDAGDIDLLLRRSKDQGRTWQPVQTVWDDGPHTCGNPCPVVDRDTGTVWLLLTHNLGPDSERQIEEKTGQGTRTVWVTSSIDDGETWSKMTEITETVKQADWTWYATGPGVGIQTRAGRLIIPCDHKVASTHEAQSHIIYSDDHGQTWQLGGVVGPRCNECQVIERRDGSLLLNMRTYERDHRRLTSVSHDGGLTWSPRVPDQTLIEPVCQASLIAIPQQYRPALPNLVLFSNPASTRREKMTIRVSHDDGQTWPAAIEIHAGPSAYSCLAVLDNETAGCLYERGQKSPYEEIVLTRVKFDLLLRGDEASQ